MIVGVEFVDEIVKLGKGVHESKIFKCLKIFAGNARNVNLCIFMNACWSISDAQCFLYPLQDLSKRPSVQADLPSPFNPKWPSQVLNNIVVVQGAK